MTDFLHPWPPPSIRGPFAEVAHEAPNHQRGWQVARRNRARSRPFFCQESRYSYGPPCTFGPPCTLLLRDSSKKSVSHYGFGEIINDRCTNTTTRTLSRHLKTDSRGTLAHSLPSRLTGKSGPMSAASESRHRGDSTGGRSLTHTAVIGRIEIPLCSEPLTRSSQSGMLARSPGWGNIAAPRCGTLAFRGVQSDHRGWSELGAVSQKAHLTRRPAGAIGITSLTAGVVCKKRSAMDQPNNRSDDPKPVIEPGRDGAEHVTTRALHLRIRQQEILA